MAERGEIEIVRLRGRNDAECAALVRGLLADPPAPARPSSEGDSYRAVAHDMLADMGAMLAFGVAPGSTPAVLARERRERYAMRLAWLDGDAR